MRMIDVLYLLAEGEIEYGTMLEMQRFLDKYFESAKEYYDEWMHCWLSPDDCW